MFRNLIDTIIDGHFLEAKQRFNETVKILTDKKLNEAKKHLIAKIVTEQDETILDENIKTNNVQKMGRIKRIRIRIRNNKIQRRKVFSNVKGYTIRHNRLVRMSAAEKRHRRIGARKAKIKRRTHKSQILRKRRMSLRKRHALGL